MNFESARALALSLPEATEEPHFHLLSFRVRGKIFATVPPERTHIHIFVEEHSTRSFAAQDPETYEGLSWGKRLAGLRVHLKLAKPQEMSQLLTEAWTRKAPKSLAKQLLNDSPRRLSLDSRNVTEKVPKIPNRKANVQRRSQRKST